MKVQQLISINVEDVQLKLHLTHAISITARTSCILTDFPGSLNVPNFHTTQLLLLRYVARGKVDITRSLFMSTSTWL